MRSKYEPLVVLGLGVVLVALFVLMCGGAPLILTGLAGMSVMFFLFIAGYNWQKAIVDANNGAAVFASLGQYDYDELMQRLALALDRAYKANISFQTEKLDLHGIGWNASDDGAVIVRKIKAGRLRREKDIQERIEKSYAAFWAGVALGGKTGLFSHESYKRYLPLPKSDEEKAAS